MWLLLWRGAGMALGDALGGQEVPVDTPVCFGTATDLKYFACFEQGPSFFPQRKPWQGICGFGEMGWEHFPCLLPPSFLFKGLLPPSINNRSVCSRSSNTGVFLSPSERKTLPSQHILCNFGRGGGWIANSIFSSLDSLINIPKDSKEEKIPVLLGFFSCSCLGLALSSWEAAWEWWGGLGADQTWAELSGDVFVAGIRWMDGLSHWDGAWQDCECSKAGFVCMGWEEGAGGNFIPAPSLLNQPLYSALFLQVESAVYSEWNVDF